MYKTSYIYIVSLDINLIVLIYVDHTPPTNQTHCYMYPSRSDMSDCHWSCDTLSPDQSDNQLLLKWALTNLHEHFFTNHSIQC